MNEMQRKPDRFVLRPVRRILDNHESEAKKLLRLEGVTDDLDQLREDPGPTKKVRKLRQVLLEIERTRNFIAKNDAKSAASNMYALAVALEKAQMSLQGSKRKGYKKDRDWLDIAIQRSMDKKLDASRPLLWNHLKLNYNGPDNAMMISENGVYGEVYFQNEKLIFYDGDKTDSIKYHTFKNKVSDLKK